MRSADLPWISLSGLPNLMRAGGAAFGQDLLTEGTDPGQG